MRAELINLPFSEDISRRIDPPLFLLQLAPVLEEEGFSVRVNDLNGIKKDHWCFGHCLLYIIYADIRSFTLAEEVACICKRISKESLIVVCGSGPTKSIKPYVESEIFSAIVCGEVEIAISNFIHDRILGREFDSKVYRSPVTNINRLPLPNRSLIEMNTYGRKLGTARAAMILGSRGSPYGATWLCSGLKTFSVQRILNEVDTIIDAYGIQAFFFGDESFIFDKGRAKNIAILMKERSLIFGFNDGINEVDYSLYSELAKFGATEVVLNPKGCKDEKMMSKICEKIRGETGIRAVMKRGEKYKNMEKQNGKRDGNSFHGKIG